MKTLQEQIVALQRANASLQRELLQCKQREEALQISATRSQTVAERLARGQTEALIQTLNVLTMEPDLDKFLGQVLTAIVEQLHVPMCTVYFHDSVQDTLSLHMTYHHGEILAGPSQLGYSGAYKPFSANLNRFWQVLLETRQPLSIPDIENDSLLKQHDGLSRQHVKSLLLIPLLLNTAIIGFLGIRSIEARHYRPEEVELAQALAHQATLAVQLTHLAEQSRQAAILEERNRLARDIHDTLAQTFTGIVVQLGAAARIAQAKREGAENYIERAQQLAREGLIETRRSVWALRSDTVQDRDLQSILKQLAQQIASDTSLNVQISIQGIPHTLSTDVKQNLLRISQEAMTNVVKHAQASSVQIVVSFESAVVKLSIRDNGRGFDFGQPGTGFGLIGMRERAECINGSLTIDSSIGQGTEIIIHIPGIATERQGGENE
ncbi:MAG: GAF domain-containing sensor histidine kinase [Ktedonobacteraceae bacterium]|nr:GAF domain-containing sensor histidine kinase [Ktedonobacteraceae bacterium]